MSDAYFQPGRSLRIAGPSKPARGLPTGYGLVAGAVASAGLWAALVWAGAQILG